MNTPVFTDLDVGRGHDLPGMAIGIGKMPRIAPEGGARFE
jgi:hypothetical protein